MLNNKTSLTLLLLLNLAVVLVSLGSGPAPAWGLRVPRQNQTTTTTRGNLTSADIEVVLATHNCYRAYALHSSSAIPLLT
jgi:hypothetical protein